MSQQYGSSPAEAGSEASDARVMTITCCPGLASVGIAVLVTCVASCGGAPASATPPRDDPPAVVDATRAVERSPSDPALRDTLGEALLLAGALDRAERVFGDALAIAPGFATAHHGVAMVRFHRADAAGGMAALNAGIALTPAVDPTYTRTRLLEAVASAHLLAGRDREAQDALDASIAAQGLDGAIAKQVTGIGRARQLLELGRWPDARAEAATAALAPGAPDYVKRAAAVIDVVALARAGDVAAAQAALAALPEFPPGGQAGMLEARFAVALATMQLDPASALVAALEPLDPYAAEQASLALARALRQSGRASEAKQRFAALAGRYLRSVPSAHARRAAAEALAQLAVQDRQDPRVASQGEDM
jgi:hypothetical protein